MSNTSVSQVAELKQYPGIFQITRHNDTFAAIIPTAQEYQMNTYHKSARLTYSVLEPVAGTDSRRVELTAAEARELLEAMQEAGRAPLENHDHCEPGRWFYRINKASAAVVQAPAKKEQTAEERNGHYRSFANINRAVAERRIAGNRAVMAALTAQTLALPKYKAVN